MTMKNKTIIIGLVVLISIIAVSFVISNSFKPAWVFASAVEKEPQNYVEITQKHIDKYPNLMKLFYEADLYHGDKGEPALGLDAMIRLDSQITAAHPRCKQRGMIRAAVFSTSRITQDNI